MKKNLLFLLFCFTISFAQNGVLVKIEAITKLEFASDSIGNAKKLSMLLDLLSQQNSSTSTIELGKLYSKIGIYYYKTKDYKKAVNYLNKGIKILNQFKNNKNLESINEVRNYLAWTYFYLDDTEKQYAVFKQIIEDDAADKYTMSAYIDYANYEARKGDFHQAINRLETYLLKKRSIDDEVRVRAVIIGIYGRMYENVFDKSISKELQIVKYQQERIEANFSKTTLDESILYTMYNNLANVYDAFGETKLALTMYLKVKKYYEKEGDLDNLMSVQNNIGYLYAKQHKFNEAISCFKNVIKEAKDVSQKATAYDNMGYYLQSVSAKEKLKYFESAIQIVLQKKDKKYTLPLMVEIKNSDYQQDILVYLMDLSYHYVLAYKETKQEKYLLEAKKAFYRIDELVSLIRYESNEEKSKLFWIEKGVDTYMLAVETCYYLNKPEEAFYFMEKNKALLLQENIRTFRAKLESEVPKKLVERENSLFYEKNIWETKLWESPNNEVVKKKYQSKLVVFNRFMDSLQQHYPKYVKIKTEVEIIKLEDAIKGHASKEQCLVSYIVNEEEGYGIFCLEKKIYFFKINDIKTLNKDVQRLKKSMINPLLNKKERSEYQYLGRQIFKQLFPFENAEELVKNKKMTVVADDFLINFPFEALTTTIDKNLIDSYLINNCEISYLQSFSLFEQIKKKKNKPIKKILVFAPTEFKEQKLNPLFRSEQSLRIFDSFNETTVFTKKEATKENFKKFSKDYEILHFNTHAGIDSISSVPWLSFQNGKMVLEELYGLENNSELVVLDACKTNQGKLASGEGVLNLSRGFFYNGTQSVLASLWNVNEKSGNEIIAKFYEELANGNTKSRALQLAKIEYIKKHQLSETTPYYWASFTLTGSTKIMLFSEKENKIYVILCVIFFTVLICLFIYKRRKLYKK